jgi:hypothetical protein
LDIVSTINVLDFLASQSVVAAYIGMRAQSATMTAANHGLEQVVIFTFPDFIIFFSFWS